MELGDAEEGEGGQIDHAENAVVDDGDLNDDGGGTQDLHIGSSQKGKGIELAQGGQNAGASQTALFIQSQPAEGAHIAHAHQGKDHAQHRAHGHRADGEHDGDGKTLSKHFRIGRQFGKV